MKVLSGVFRERSEIEQELAKEVPLKSGSRDDGIAKEPRPLVPDGFYDAIPQAYKVIPFKGSEKIYLKCMITGPTHHETEIYVIFTKYKKYGARSNLYKAWQLAHKRKPQKGDRIGPSHLLNFMFRIQTRTVERDENGVRHPEFARYSVATIVDCVQMIDCSKR